jgi:tetratricopeptide (TPR) repeat protein
MSESLQRGILLFGQNRHELAAEQFGTHLAANPNDAHAHGMLALCLAESEDYKEATNRAAEAIRLAPDYAFAHYVMAYVLAERNRFNEAISSILEAIRLDPYDADHFALLSRIHLEEKRHQQALDAAEQGLQIDPEHVSCQNLRALALKNLGRHMDAAEALESALARNPENAVTHANKGWALLEKNKPEEALQHFQEALRINPTIDWAREGIVTALKSRYRIYGLMLKYFLWMRKLSSRAQWGVILGVYFLSRALGAVSASKPEIAPYILPFRLVLLAFVLLTWIADPLFNLALRLNSYGRLALTKEQKLSSTLVGVCIGLSLLFLLSGFALGFSFVQVALSAAIGLLALPISSTFSIRVGWPRRLMGCYAAAMATALTLTIIFYWLSRHGADNTGPFAEAMLVTGGLYLVGLIGVGWVANILAMSRGRR